LISVSALHTPGFISIAFRGAELYTHCAIYFIFKKNCSLQGKGKFFCGQDSVVLTATRTGWTILESNPGWGDIFSSLIDRLLGPPSIL